MRDAAGVLVDGPTVMKMNRITAGALGGSLRWESTEDTPGVTSKATLSFTTSGAMLQGGSLALALPSTGQPTGWAMNSSSPTVSFVMPSSSVVASNTSWAQQPGGTNGTLVIHTSGEDIGEGDNVVVVVSGVTTPPSVPGANPCSSSLPCATSTAPTGRPSRTGAKST